jgi:N4-gp56 family major capsid protein
MAGITLSTTVSAQFRAYFSKELLTYPVQLTILDQFARKASIPKNGGNKSITMFRWGSPSITDVQALTEGTVPAASTSHQLALSSITKSLLQYGHRVTLTDIMKATELFNSVSQATKVTGQNLAVWTDSVVRNTAIGSNLTASNGSIGSAAENGGALDNSDTLVEVYGRPASTTQTYTGLNSDTTTCTTDSATLLDLMTKLKRNRAPEAEGGGYVYVTDPRTARDIMRDSDWLNASQYGNGGKPYYKGEVGSIYGIRVVVQTNSFVSLGSATAADRYIYATSGGGGTGTGKDIIVSFALGSEAWGVPQLSGDNPFSPSIDILDKPDKSDPHNQNIIVAAKAYFTALRLNPNYYIVHRSKTAHTL